MWKNSPIHIRNNELHARKLIVVTLPNQALHAYISR